MITSYIKKFDVCGTMHIGATAMLSFTSSAQWEKKCFRPLLNACVCSAHADCDCTLKKFLLSLDLCALSQQFSQHLLRRHSSAQQILFVFGGNLFFFFFSCRLRWFTVAPLAVSDLIAQNRKHRHKHLNETIHECIQCFLSEYEDTLRWLHLEIVTDERWTVTATTPTMKMTQSTTNNFQLSTIHK